jgi:4-alpha-glucanotransferase
MVYPATHDMPTVRGWWNNASPVIQNNARLYMGVDGHDIAWDLVRLAMSSVADMAVFQMQDLLDLDNSARLNRPGTTEGNWTWRYHREQLTHALAERLATLTRIYGRDRPQSKKLAQL